MSYRLLKELEQYTEDAKNHDEPWKLWERAHVNSTDSWRSCHSETYMFSSVHNYRHKPKTITINDVECPDDFMNCSISYHTVYWIESAHRKPLCYKCIWKGDTEDYLFLNRGIAHKTREGAIEACKARHGIK